MRRPVPFRSGRLANPFELCGSAALNSSQHKYACSVRLQEELEAWSQLEQCRLLPGHSCFPLWRSRSASFRLVWSLPCRFVDPDERFCACCTVYQHNLCREHHRASLKGAGRIGFCMTGLARLWAVFVLLYGYEADAACTEVLYCGSDRWYPPREPHCAGQASSSAPSQAKIDLPGPSQRQPCVENDEGWQFLPHHLTTEEVWNALKVEASEQAVRPSPAQG